MKHHQAVTSLCIAGLSFLAASAGLAKQAGGVQKIYDIPRVSGPITIDGELGEKAWADAWVMELAYEVKPGENLPAPVRTQVLVTYDENNVYFAFRAFDPEPSQIRAHLVDRDKIHADDWVGVVFDTFNDERRGYDFNLNPRGVQGDMIESTSSMEDWDGIWESASQIYDWGYAVEARVPFSTLRFQRTTGTQVWGFDAVRNYPRSRRSYIGVFSRDRNNNCYYCQFLKIRGFASVHSGSNTEITPTLTAVQTDTRRDFPDGPMETGARKGEAGLTARWGITPNLNLVGTINPDFSQVEADALQLDINQPFALSFAEKRPFFMEGADFFSTRIKAVYTRTVRDPVWGVKLSGKEDGNTLGMFVVRDDTTNILIPGSQSSRETTLDLQSTAGAVRYKKDFGNTFTFGVLGAFRQADGYANRVFGLDSDLRLSDKDFLKLQILGSSTRYPGSIADEFNQKTGDFRDWAAELMYERQTRNTSFYVNYRDVGEGFRADFGFLPQVDYRKGEAGGTYKWVPNGRTWFSTLQTQGGFRRLEDQAGNLLYREAWLQGQYEGPLQSGSTLRLLDRREAYNGEEFSIKEFYLSGSMQPVAGGQIGLAVTIGDQIDYANTRLGKRLRINPTITQSIGPHLGLAFDATLERMREGGERLYDAKIASATIAYQFNTRSFLRAVLRFVDYDFNTGLYSDGRDARTKRLLAQYLFSYKLNPQTVLFLGYSDTAHGTREYALTKSNRTLFAKIGYAWLM